MSNVQILIVEDESIIAIDIQNKLENLGYHVIETAFSGKEALEQIAQTPPDLILMDINLGEGLDGIATAEVIHKKYNIPVIFLTAYSDDKTLQRAKSTGPFGFMNKPFRQRELRATIEMALYRHSMNRKLAESEARYRTLAESAQDFIFLIDPQGNVQYINAYAASALNRTPGQITGKPFEALFSPGLVAPQTWSTLFQSGKTISFVAEVALSNAPLWLDSRFVSVRDSNGQTIAALGILRDITPIKQAEQQLQKMATHDALTNLPNRVLFQDRLDNALAQAHRNNRTVALLFLDLDGFKTVNDTLGHEYGDQLLQSVARRLLNCIREGDTAARLGGDEFVVILPNSGQLANVTDITDRICTAINRPFNLGQHTANIAVSIGISLYPQHGQDAKTLLKNADDAMYQAKQQGKNRYCIYTPG